MVVTTLSCGRRKASWIILATEASQFVVLEAAVTASAQVIRQLLEPLGFGSHNLEVQRVMRVAARIEL